MKKIDAWWPKSPKPGNFGDIMTPWLVKKKFKVDLLWRPRPFTQKTLLCIGSLLNATDMNSIVWGSGAISRLAKPDPNAKYFAVRGPLSRELVLSNGGECPEIYGDPALLCKSIYNPEINKEYKYGIFPHYVDYELCKKQFQSNSFNIINPLTENIEHTIKEIIKCEFIVTSSLHGWIVSHTYGIPSALVKFGNKLAGDGIKFEDYASTVGVDDFIPKEFDSLKNCNFTLPSTFPDLKRLCDVFPIGVS